MIGLMKADSESKAHGGTCSAAASMLNIHRILVRERSSLSG
jgi:hypothetical protein